MAVQLVVSTLCKYRLTSLKQVTRLSKKQLLLYKPRNSTDLKCLQYACCFSYGTSQKRKHPSVRSFNMQLIQLSRAQDSLCLSFPHQFINVCILLLGTYVCSTQQHYSPKVYGQCSIKLQADRCSYLKCCSRLRRRRRLQRITGSSLATTCGPLILQRIVKQKHSVRAV